MLIIYNNSPPFKKFIRNHDKPKCRDCKFFKSNRKCSKFGSSDLVTGIIYFDSAYDCRFDEKKCGIQATYYEENYLDFDDTYFNNLSKYYNNNLIQEK
jgi:hypothetical protein